MEEEQLVKSRLKDLAQRAYKQNIYTYSNFMTPAELGWFRDLEKDISYIDYSLSGGYDLAERQMICFGSEDMFGYEGQFPISVIRVEPLIDKFSDQLNHRDFLGAVMNLGIERNVVGDILVRDNKIGYIFCMDSIAEYILDNLLKIKHTSVKCSLLSKEDSFTELAPKIKEVSVIVASARFDAIVAALTKASRSDALSMFKSGKITLNGVLCERNSQSLKEEDIFSIRGYGKYRYLGSGKETRKGKIYVNIGQYV
ncbi:MAG: hypothetical protein IJX12_03165 [Lachnospiraceae bacterium]|nr:hypothetical protein [Lachnospiraceae bacterium]